jgi:hypothetical protein
MRTERVERCGRCGGDPFHAGEPYTFWIWLPEGEVLEERALRLCLPCGREFPTQRDRSEYLKLALFG